MFCYYLSECCCFDCNARIHVNHSVNEWERRRPFPAGSLRRTWRWVVAWIIVVVNQRHDLVMPWRDGDILASPQPPFIEHWSVARSQSSIHYRLNKRVESRAKCRRNATLAILSSPGMLTAVLHWKMVETMFISQDTLCLNNLRSNHKCETN